MATTLATTEKARTKTNQVHLVLHGKGGVGKSLISAILGQYFQHRKTAPHCFDTDPVNATFAQYQAMGAEHINVLRRGAIHDKRFDELFEKNLPPGLRLHRGHRRHNARSPVELPSRK